MSLRPGAGRVGGIAHSRQAALGRTTQTAEDFSDTGVRTIGVLEILGGVGLLLPAVTGVATVLVPLAAVGLALLMVGAAATHRRRGELPMIGINAVLLLLAVVVAWARSGPYPL
jgi:uncharacterized membrane protein